MERPRALARIIGPLLVVPAVGAVLNLGTYQRLIEEFGKSPALCYLGGFMALLMGLVILELLGKWEARWSVIITILGWIALVKGVALILFPGIVLNLWYPHLESTAPLMISFGISFVIGTFLIIKGYWGTAAH